MSHLISRASASFAWKRLMKMAFMELHDCDPDMVRISPSIARSAEVISSLHRFDVLISGISSGFRFQFVAIVFMGLLPSCGLQHVFIMPGMWNATIKKSWVLLEYISTKA
jgi:hypothetical protein